MHLIARMTIAAACLLASGVPGTFSGKVPGTFLGAQERTFPVPPNVRADGVPPIPMALVEAIAPYGQFRRARLLAWHPTERRILIATKFGDALQIHEVGAPGDARRQLTFFRDGVEAPGERPLVAYEPHGRSFVFQKDVAGGGEANQLFRYDFASGSAALITDGKSRNEYPVVSRTGDVAYSTTRRNGKDRDIYVVNPADPEKDRRVLEAAGNWLPLEWSPDGTKLLVLELISNAQMRLWLVDAATGERTALTAREGSAVRWYPATFSRDGRTVYALSNLGGEGARLWRRDLANEDWTAVTGTDESLEGFALSPDGRTLALIVDRGADSLLQLQDVTGRRRPTPALPTGVITDLAWHSNGREIGFSIQGSRAFHDVYSVHVASGKTERWTWSESGGANPDSLPDAELVRWKSFDGLMISGVLYRPPARFTGPRPVIINVHGGPDQRERPRGLGRSNYFRNEMGIAVIYPNVRGSSGFGRSFEEADNGRLRENAVKDIGALLDWIAAEPSLDEKRVMIVGASYGGYMALASAIQYGDRIRCVQAGFAISDFPSYLESTDLSRQGNRNAEYGDPADPETREFLTRISPLANAAKLRVPLYLAHGARDTRIPPAQAEMMANAVKKNGTPVWHVVYEDAGHLTLSPPNNDFNQYSWTVFVQKYLLD
jgi:dipeptidyl aminopeptidase/acylaminoacyl peptidase